MAGDFFLNWLKKIVVKNDLNIPNIMCIIKNKIK